MHGTLEFAAAVLEHALVTEARAIPQSLAQDSDDALVRASQTGDTEAFGRLYQRYARMVHGILLSRVQVSDAEDLVQDVFLRALPRLSALRDVSRFGAWLAAIARNLATDFHRRIQARAEGREDPADPAEHPASGSVSESSEATEVLECVLSLPEAYRETLILRLVEGLSGPEIAARTGLSPGSVRVNLHRGMRQLREKLALRAMPQNRNSAQRKGGR
jgi:RNA polymerase sigma-70 factor, ECF subfamily